MSSADPHLLEGESVLHDTGAAQRSGKMSRFAASFPSEHPHIKANIPAVMSSHRNTVTTVVSLSQNQVNQLTNDLSYRCMVYCAAVEQFSPFVRNTEIAFPHQVELRVNETVVAGPGLNLRGLKNKPGSTRPADITDRLNLTPNYRNQIGLTYAMTQKVRS